MSSHVSVLLNTKSVLGTLQRKGYQTADVALPFICAFVDSNSLYTVYDQLTKNLILF